jgi:sugar O-acyltransferase (sialic acid O-acetyltransferase NeuD family)
MRSENLSSQPTGQRERIGLLGNGGQAREIEGFLGIETIIFNAVSPEFLDPGNAKIIDINSRETNHLETAVLAVVGSPGLRRDLVSMWAGNRYTNLLISPFVSLSREDLGAGVFIAEAAVVTSGVRFGNHVHVNIASTVSHDVFLADFVTIGPGVHIGGGVSIGEGSFVGIGAVVKHQIKICSGALIGAGAVVVHDVTEPGTYVGNPARLISARQSWQALSD